MRFAALLLLAGCATPTAQAIASRELESCVKLQLFAQQYGHPVLIDCRVARMRYCWVLLKEMGCQEAREEELFLRAMDQRPLNPAGIGR